MSNHPFDRIIHRVSRKKSSAPEPAPPSPSTPARAAPDGVDSQRIDPDEERELKVQRDRLIEKFTVMQADLGGAFYEMAIRDHVRMDVLTSKAAELQAVDAELLTVERLLEIENFDTEGVCSTCGTPFAKGTVFCSQCGSSVQQSPAIQ